MIYKDEVVILYSYDCKEYDRLYDVFSNKFGKKTIVAKGVRKPKAKLAGGLEPITSSEIFLAKGRGFDKVTGVIIRDQFPQIKKDIAKINEIRKLFFVIKKSFTDRQREGEISKKIYDLIHFYLNFLEKGDFNEKINLNIKLDIYWKIIHWMGYQPGVFQCFNCGKKIEELDFYSFFIPYGVACEKCCKKENGSFAQEIKIDKNSLKILRFFLVNPVGAAAKVDIPLISVKKIEKIIKLTLERVIEKRVDL